MPGKPKVFLPFGRGKQNTEINNDRASARDRGYTPAWDRASIAYRAAHPLCVGCQAIGRVVAAEVVDHVIPHRGDRVLFWDPGNWQSACTWHHSVVKQLLERMYAQGKAAAADLRLDSARAVKLTLALLPDGGRGGRIFERIPRGPVG